jgi:N-acetylmuramoyl-L-alanine amidase
MNIIEQYLTMNMYSRPGKPLAGVQGIILHYTGMPWQRAPTVWRYFETDCPKQKHYSSAQYCIDINGDVYQCMPDLEVAYHTGSSQTDPASGRIYTDWARKTFGRFAENPETLSPNLCTIGIELCYTDREGRFSDETYNAARMLTARLCKKYAVPLDRIGTHHLVVGWKDCPLWWTNRPDEFEQFKADVQAVEG